jgi:hypothetical protein
VKDFSHEMIDRSLSKIRLENEKSPKIAAAPFKEIEERKEVAKVGLSKKIKLLEPE